MAEQTGYNEIRNAELFDHDDEIEGKDPPNYPEKQPPQEIAFRTDLDWKEIVNECVKGNIRFVKNMIRAKDIDINSQNASDGKTLLIYASIVGSLAMVTAVCDAGADLSITDHKGRDALNYAIAFGRPPISELLCYREVSGSAGKNLHEIATKIHSRSVEAQSMYQHEFKMFDHILIFMIKAIEKRTVFSPHMLFHAMYFVIKEWERSNYEEEQHPMYSDLWVEMMQTFEDIIQDTNDTKGWKWLAANFNNSLIWFLPHPHHMHQSKNIKRIEEIGQDEEEDRMTLTLKKTLFFELLKRIKAESQRQSVLLIKERMNTVKTTTSRVFFTFCFMTFLIVYLVTFVA
eukprot:284851_1